MNLYRSLVIILLISILFTVSPLKSDTDEWSVIIDLVKNDEMETAREELSSIILNSYGDDLLIASEILASTYKYEGLKPEEFTALFNIIIDKYENYNYRELSTKIRAVEGRIVSPGVVSSEMAEIYSGFEDYEKALSIYEKLYDEYPNDDNSPWFLYYILILKRKLGEEATEEVRQEILDEFPGSIPAMMVRRGEDDE